MTDKAKAIADNVPVYCAHDAIVDIDELIPNPKNPNEHPPEQIALLAKIIKRTGWRAPITVSKLSGFVVKGHGRLLSAKKAGLKFVPVDYQAYENEAQEYADLMADNRIAELSEINDEKLKNIFEEIEFKDDEIELTGYDQEFLDNLLNEAEDEDEEEIEGDVKFTEVLREEHNYVVLYFDNEIDWLQAQSLLNIKPAMRLSTRKDGSISSNKKIGLGRVLNGAKALEDLKNAYKCELSLIQETESKDA